MKRLVDKLRERHELDSEEYHSLLIMHDPQDIEYLFGQAHEVSQRHFGRSIYLRGLIELSNVCRNNCLYCGIRRGNCHVSRYNLNLSPEKGITRKTTDHKVRILRIIQEFLSAGGFFTAALQS